MRSAALIGGFLTLAYSSVVGANLQVYPTRVVLSDKERVSQVTLTYTGTDPVTYEAVPVFYTQDRRGRMSSVEGSHALHAPHSAVDLVRFSPRVFTLATGQTQVLKIRAQPKADLADGAYRVHLRVQPVATPLPNPSPQTSVPAANPTKNKASLQLNALLAIAFPIYFSHGTVTTKLDIRDVKLESNGSKLSFVLKQEGNGFLFGDISVTSPGAKPDKGKDKSASEKQWGHLFNMASYAAEREVEISLDPPFKKSEAGETLRVEISQSPDEGGSVIFTKDTPVSSL